MSYPIPSKHMSEAMEARTHLHIFAAVVAILEGGTISGRNKAAEQIIAICKREQQRQLRIMDAAVAKANQTKGE